MSSEENHIGVEEARKQLGDLADAAFYRNATTILTRRGRPVARIAPLEPTMPTRTDHDVRDQVILILRESTADPAAEYDIDAITREVWQLDQGASLFERDDDADQVDDVFWRVVFKHARPGVAPTDVTAEFTRPADDDQEPADADVDYVADAPDFTAWAGNGHYANLIHQEGRLSEVYIQLWAAVNAQVARLIKDGMDTPTALAAYDPEELARRVWNSR